MLDLLGDIFFNRDAGVKFVVDANIKGRSTFTDAARDRCRIRLCLGYGHRREFCDGMANLAG